MKRVCKSISIGLIIGCAMLSLVGCGKGNSNMPQPADKMDPSVTTQTEVEAIETTPIATMIIKDYGTITLELYPDMAPNTVNNFITLANDGFYDGLTFHRVINGFMIQGGDPNGNGSGGPGYSITGEFADNGFNQNTLSHKKGIISMARTGMPNSAGSQFFIMSADDTYLDGKYAAFGKVTSGIEVVESIEKLETDNQDKPIKEVVIESISVETNGVEVPSVIKTEG